MSLTLMLASSILDVYYDATNAWLYLDWKGPQELAQVQAAARHVSVLIAQTGAQKILNDSTHVTFTGGDVARWAASEYLPQAGRDGVEYVAWVASPMLGCYNHIDVMTQPLGQHPHVAAFDDVAGACAWLSNLSVVASY